MDTMFNKIRKALKVTRIACLIIKEEVVDTYIVVRYRHLRY